MTCCTHVGKILLLSCNIHYTVMISECQIVQHMAHTNHHSSCNPIVIQQSMNTSQQRKFMSLSSSYIAILIVVIHTSSTIQYHIVNFSVNNFTFKLLKVKPTQLNIIILSICTLFYVTELFPIQKSTCNENLHLIVDSEVSLAAENVF